MLRKLKAMFGGRKTRSLEAQVAELRAALAAVLTEVRPSIGEPGSVDAVLLHAAEARLEAERLSALYEAAIARVAAMEERLDALQSATG